MMKPRVRFAPSPTGPLHIGGVRTALFNYLFAKQHGGTFLLRIEDTDQHRFVAGAEDYIIESFQWLGIAFDEGVHIGGKHAPYRQSERKNIYRQYADQLLSSGWAYLAFDDPEALEAKRKEYEVQKKTFQYDVFTRLDMENSLSLPPEEVQRRLSAGHPYVVRFKFPKDRDIELDDLIRGKVVVNTGTLDDKVLFKSDGMPTYHLANIVDDHLMEITHVIRGEEWLPSAPLHVMLYEALGWQPPQFAHLPLILKPDGNGKLSKRDGDRLGFPVFPLQWKNPDTGEISTGYREKGYLPDAVINMLALLGWNPGTEQELFSLDELVNIFSLEKISKSGSKFNPEKAKWFNHQYIIKTEDHILSKFFGEMLQKNGVTAPEDKLIRAVALVKERVNLLGEFQEQAGFLFIAPRQYDEQVIKKRWDEQMPSRLEQMIALLKTVVPFDKTVAHDKVMSWIHDHAWHTGNVMNCLRLALVGAAKGPDIFEIIDFLGMKEVEQRVLAANKRVGNGFPA
ncbi:MAG: glutamate--tRNA ligase [Bacteroidales bacterium]|jgi:glutamyl-tRNA synthetase|nr:glutamate--tRNA ligase [Bacteroidales bacterium]